MPTSRASAMPASCRPTPPRWRGCILPTPLTFPSRTSTCCWAGRSASTSRSLHAKLVGTGARRLLLRAQPAVRQRVAYAGLRRHATGGQSALSHHADPPAHPHAAAWCTPTAPIGSPTWGSAAKACSCRCRFGLPAEPSRQFAWTYRAAERRGGWMLQSLRDGAWVDLYAFTREPQELADYEMANYWVSTHPSSRFVQTLDGTAARRGGATRPQGPRAHAGPRQHRRPPGRSPTRKCRRFSPRSSACIWSPARRLFPPPRGTA